MATTKDTERKYTMPLWAIESPRAQASRPAITSAIVAAMSEDAAIRKLARAARYMGVGFDPETARIVGVERNALGLGSRGGVVTFTLSRVESNHPASGSK